MSTVRPQDIPIFRPYPDEVPWALLACAGGDEDTLAATLEPDRIRVAKDAGTVAGCYAIRPINAICFELVALAVADGYRRHGLGRWLLGHAIGLAESKGAREILVRGQRHRRFLARVGFEPDGDDLRLTLTPE